MRGVVRSVLVGASLAMTGCPGPDLTADPWVEVGTGEVEFVRLAGAPDVPITRGLQGGRHIWGAARVTGIDWREVTLNFELLDADDLTVEEPTLLQTRLAACPTETNGCEPGMGEIVGVTLLVEDPGAIIGDETTIRCTAADTEGRRATGRAVVVPQWDSGG